MIRRGTSSAPSKHNYPVETGRQLEKPAFARGGLQLCFRILAMTLRSLSAALILFGLYLNGASAAGHGLMDQTDTEKYKEACPDYKVYSGFSQSVSS